MIFDRWQEALTPVSTRNTEAERTGVGRGRENNELQNYNKKVVYRVDTERQELEALVVVARPPLSTVLPLVTSFLLWFFWPNSWTLSMAPTLEIVAAHSTFGERRPRGERSTSRETREERNENAASTTVATQQIPIIRDEMFHFPTCRSCLFHTNQERS